MQHLISAISGAAVRWQDFPGEGDPVFFIHGLGCAASYEYPRIIADPAWRGRSAVLVDLPGSGYSDRPVEYAYAIRQQAAVVREVIDAAGCERCSLYGHSMGGSIAIEVATALGDRLVALAVSEPNFYPGGGFFSRQIAAGPEAEFVREGYAALVEKEHSPWRGSLQATAPYALWRAANSLIEGTSPDWMTQFLALQCRKTLIVGAQTLPDQDAEFVAGQGIGVEIVADAGHSMSWENPAGLAAVLGAFFR